MVSKNVIKNYQKNTFYHLYNRGVEKRIIFHDDQDRNKFLSLLDRYLNENNSETDANNVIYEKFHENVQIHSYALMDNHFHLLCKTLDSPNYIYIFMKSLCSSYTQYFNKKYDRVGHLYQGCYKSSAIYDEYHLLTVCKYIHLNPITKTQKNYSSINVFLGIKHKEDWMTTNEIHELIPKHKFKNYLESGEYTKVKNDSERV